MTGDAVFLMYHELEAAGHRTVQNLPSYVRYVVSAEDFRHHLAHLRATGRSGASVGEALAAMDERAAVCISPGGPSTRVVITFDDGCETDLLYAAPLLREAGFNATFYVVAGLTGRWGYLSERQARELSDSGFEIGSHSMTHRHLSDLDTKDLRLEMVESKDQLEQITGKRVEHFSCPGGRWSNAVAVMAAEAGYASVVTSRPGKNSCASSRFSLARMTVMRGTGVDDFDRLCRAEVLLRQRAQGAVLDVAKRLLGNYVYERIRSTVLD